VKEVDAGADHSQNPADHERITEDLKAELQKLKQAYEALCSEKDKKVAEITAERDFVRDQFKTLERDYADLRSYMNNKSTRDSEAALELQKNVEQLQLASQKKDEEIRKLRARVKAAAEAKRKLVPERKLQKMDSTPKKIDKEIEKCKDRQPEASKKHKKDTSGTPKKGCSEGPALVTETRNYSSNQMLAEDGRPEASQKRKCDTFLSSVSISFPNSKFLNGSYQTLL
jgi:chromosome segregation ATPase